MKTFPVLLVSASGSIRVRTDAGGLLRPRRQGDLSAPCPLQLADVPFAHLQAGVEAVDAGHLDEGVTLVHRQADPFAKVPLHDDPGDGRPDSRFVQVIAHLVVPGRSLVHARLRNPHVRKGERGASLRELGLVGLPFGDNLCLGEKKVRLVEGEELLPLLHGVSHPHVDPFDVTVKGGAQNGNVVGAQRDGRAHVIGGPSEEQHGKEDRAQDGDDLEPGMLEPDEPSE